MSDRPQFTITCDGIGDKPHKPAIVAVYARDHDGTWLPHYSAVRDGKDVLIRKTGDNAEAGQFDWRCPQRRCTYRFRAAAGRVSSVLDRLLDAGCDEAPLRFIDQALRHTAEH